MEESDMIDSYLKGERNEESLAAIELKINSDPSFKAKVELRKKVIKAIHLAYEHELKVKLKELDRSMDEKANYFKTRYMIAASLALVLVTSFGIYIYLNNSKAKFEKYDIYEVGIPNTMGASEDRAFDVGMNHFKSSQYSEALRSFEGLNQSDTVLYYSGVAAYRIGSLDKAMQYFQKIEEGSEYFTKANYRIGLAYWKENQINLAIPVLLKVTQDTSSEYGTNAKIILTKEF
jgi:tetratricopeptide (TPR) repeat protein